MQVEEISLTSSEEFVQQRYFSMGLKFVIIVSAIFASTFIESVQGRRSNSGNRNSGNRYQWSRDLGQGSTVAESAYAPTDKEVVYLKSLDDGLIAAGFAKAEILYDFTSSSPLLVISLTGRGRSSPCYITNTALTHLVVTDTLSGRNGQTAPVGTQVSLSGTGALLSRSEARSLISSNTALRRFCRKGKLVRTTQNPSVDAANNGTEVVKVLTLDSEVLLTIPATTTQQGSRGDRGNRGGRGGSRGRGGRNN